MREVPMLTYDSAFKRLSWDMEKYEAVSGPWGSGSLPKGEYAVKVYDVVVNSPEPGFTDPMTGQSWFIPIKPKFATLRSGLGIHPDGNVPGTEGCIGVKSPDASKFWEKWNSLGLGARPTALTVK
jgi:hypothetical protein